MSHAREPDFVGAGFTLPLRDRSILASALARVGRILGGAEQGPTASPASIKSMQQIRR